MANWKPRLGVRRSESLNVASSPRLRKSNIATTMKTSSSLTSINGKSTTSKLNGNPTSSSLKQVTIVPASPRISKGSVLPKITKDSSKLSGSGTTTMLKTAANGTNTKPPTTQSTKEIVQRLTNGGIPVVKPRRQRRFSLYITATTPGSKAPVESFEPKSILKKTSRRSSISNGEIAICGVEPLPVESLSLSKSLLSLYPIPNEDLHISTPSSRYNEEMPPVLESHLKLSEQEILKNCSYRLDAEPVSTQDLGSKKVTFEDDVAVFKKQSKRRYYVPSIE